MGDLLEFEQQLRQIAHGLDEIMKELWGRKGFCLIVFDFNEPGVSNYISNANREDMIKSLKETIERFENNEIIPAVQHDLKQ